MNKLIFLIATFFILAAVLTVKTEGVFASGPLIFVDEKGKITFHQGSVLGKEDKQNKEDREDKSGKDNEVDEDRADKDAKIESGKNADTEQGESQIKNQGLQITTPVKDDKDDEEKESKDDEKEDKDDKQEKRGEDNEFEFFGTVGSIGETQWTVENKNITISEETEIEDNIQIGTLVKVHAVPQTDGLLLAREIERATLSEIQKEEEGLKGKIKLKSEDGEIEIKVATEEGGERKLKIKQEENKFLIRMRENDMLNDVQIKTSNNRFMIEQRGMVAQTQLPLEVDTTTNQVAISTPFGQVTLQVLPAVAIENILESDIADQVSTTEIVQNPDKDDAQNKVVYRIEGIKKVRFLGILPVTAEITAEVGAGTGETVSVDRPWYLDMFGLLFRT